MTSTNSHASRYPRAYKLAIIFLILLSIVLMAGCRRSAANEDPEEQEISTVTPTVTPTVAPTATHTSTPIAEPTEEAPRAKETPPADATDEDGAETPTPLATADEVGSSDAPTDTVDVVGIVESNAISVTNTLDPASEKKESAEEKSEEQEAGNGAAGEEMSSTVTLPEETTEASMETSTEAPVEKSTAEPQAESATEEASPPVAAPTSSRPLDETVNILVLGSDRRPGAPNWRTDVIMIVALDIENGRAGVISIPRDVYVNSVPGGYSSNKINTMDYFGEANHPGGGPELLSAIIEQKMGIPIHHFVRFNFETFKEVVDALGGVEVEFECSFFGDLGGRAASKRLRLEPGTYRLNGDQATVYVRSRAVGGDLDRAERQQRFVWSIREQVRSENLLPKLPALYSALSGSVQTDIGLLDAVRLARFVVDLEPADVHAFVVAPPDMLSYGRSRRLSYFYPHWNVIAKRAQKIFETEGFAETYEIVDSAGRECK